MQIGSPYLFFHQPEALSRAGSFTSMYAERIGPILASNLGMHVLTHNKQSQQETSKMNQILEKALQTISSSINPSTGLGHPSDMLTTANRLGEAVQKMERPEHPDDVADYLQSLGRVGSETAKDVALIYEALWCFIKNQTPHGH